MLQVHEVVCPLRKVAGKSFVGHLEIYMNPYTESLQCRYAYANCLEKRAVKRDGLLHALCEIHREKANAYAAKRRQQLQRIKSEDCNDECDMLVEGSDLFLEPMSLHTGPAAFSSEDCELLGQIMKN
ncbi:hypothetical protein H310_10034 [Aphanomyces invadans]|uniref:Uncharacterized protein n=1 Tax=Aphanomyces invadans TaxID=157072 RepID=A0A024TTQ6_9STRA|nr:hypothetical protein H310_10034 [Aphanomyces invadans]ETV96717.1 hypothetical protein H310_10034 [Aphanomyces invadans]|eukprot:XP_008874494.1 hypothetical protein H310_10034 [Aphanomyces invadans]